MNWRNNSGGYGSISIALYWLMPILIAAADIILLRMLPGRD